MNEGLHVFCYGPGDWRVEGARMLDGACVARCTTRESAWAALRLLSGQAERPTLNAVVGRTPLCDIDEDVVMLFTPWNQRER